MRIINEQIRRGIPGFPLGYYVQVKEQENCCITPLHYHYDLEFILPDIWEKILLMISKINLF